MTDSLTLPRSPILQAIDRAVYTDPRLKSQHTISQYRSALTSFEQWRNGRPMTKSLVEEYAAALQKMKYSPNTINQDLSAIRWWARKVLDVAEDQMEDTPATRKTIRQAARVLSVRDVKGIRTPRGRYLPREEQTALLNACASDPTPAGTRDAAMIAVALSVGLRRDDLTTLEIENVKNVTEESCDLVIHGKGDRVDVLYLYNGGFKRLMSWLQLRGMDPGRVFCQVRKNDKINTKGKLSGEALRLILDQRQIGLGLPEHLTWHDFRKTFICTHLDSGTDLSTTQKLARHQSPNTTANIYDIRDESVKRAAMQTIKIGE